LRAPVWSRSIVKYSKVIVFWRKIAVSILAKRCEGSWPPAEAVTRQATPIITLTSDFGTRDPGTWRSGRRSFQSINTNALGRGRRWRIGLSKTGFLEEAGQCLVMQTRLADRPVVIVLLDSWGKYTRLGDAQRIKQWMEGPEPRRKVIRRRAKHRR